MTDFSPICGHSRWEEVRQSGVTRRVCFASVCQARLGKHEFMECEAHTWIHDDFEYGGSTCIDCGKRQGSNGRR